MLNLKHLYYYHIFTQEQSTAKAANRLRITSSALSSQLKELDEYVGTPLTRRTGGKFRITERGEIVSLYAERMFCAYEELKTKLTANWDLNRIRFSAGISENIGAQFAFDLIKLIEGPSFFNSPRVQLTFDSADRILEDFMKGQYDLIFGAFSPKADASNDWITQTVSYPVRLFGPPSLGMGFEVFEKQVLVNEFSRVIELANSKNISLVLPAHPSVLRKETERFLSDLGVQALKIVECNTSSGIIKLIERGFAMGLIPTPCLLDFRSASKLATLGPVGGYWSHSLSILIQKKVGKSVLKTPNLSEFFLSAEFN